MYGLGVLRGLWIVFKHFIGTFADDVRWWGRRYNNPEALAVRQGPNGQGIFTVQYPEEKWPVPEAFRYLPFLVYDEGADGVRDYRCTACGMCAKVCPPQCIWIERATDPATGKPLQAARAFSIDMDACMSCGFCAEYCPCDAIKLDQVYELATGERGATHLWDKARLGKPVSHHAAIHPVDYARELAVKAAKAAKK